MVNQGEMFVMTSPIPQMPQNGMPYAQPQAPVQQQQFAQQVPVQQYAQPQVPAQPVTATLGDVFGGGSYGPSVTWKDLPNGSKYRLRVERDLNQADIKQSRDYHTKQPLTYPDGNPRLEVWIPVEILEAPAQVVAKFSEGKGVWVVRGHVLKELNQAMAAAGLPPKSAPEAGAVIDLELMGRSQNSRGGIRNDVRVTYTRPAAPSAEGQAAQAAPAQEQAQAPAPQQTTNLQVPEGLTPEQQALMAKLTGGQAA